MFSADKSFQPPPLWSGGPQPGKFYEFPACNKSQNDSVDPVKRTMYPSTTGASVVAFMYDDGILMAADTQGSYGSLSRFTNVERVFKVTDKAVLACGGDIADYQSIRAEIEQKARDDECSNNSKILDAGALHCWLTRVLYYRRSKFDPLWLDCVVGGFHDDKPYLGFVNKIGMAYEASEISSGFGVHFCLPLIRDAREKKASITKDDAHKLMKECMKLLYYRDCRAYFKYQIADITKDGVNIETINFKRETNWGIAHITQGY